jgi:hypothetical protein
MDYLILYDVMNMRDDMMSSPTEPAEHYSHPRCVFLRNPILARVGARSRVISQLAVSRAFNTSGAVFLFLFFQRSSVLQYVGGGVFKVRQGFARCLGVRRRVARRLRGWSFPGVIRGIRC